MMVIGRIWFAVESMTGFCTSGAESLDFAMYVSTFHSTNSGAY